MKKGFTLIELLAVIVILAIIALIATPIVLNIINDTKESAGLRSAEMYLDGVEQAIMKSNMNGTFNPNTCEINGNGNLKCDEKTEEVTVEVDGEKPKGGSISFEDGKINEVSLIFKNNEIVVKNEEGNLVYENNVEPKEILVNLSDVCTPVTEATKTTGNVPTGNYNIGDEYTCEVKEGTSYIFFVLSKEDNKVNLIMDSNIRKDGTPVKDTTDLGSVEWLSDKDYAAAGGKVTDDMLNDGGACQYGNVCLTVEYGPITAMSYLNKATETWEKVSSLAETYDDEYGLFKNFKITGHARMPKASELLAFDYDWDKRYPLYMVNYLVGVDPTSYPNGTESCRDGYWALSSFQISYTSLYMHCSGGLYVEGDSIAINDSLGVRPVITLKI